MDNTKFTKGKWSVERKEDKIYDQEVFAISTPTNTEFITVWNGVEELEEEQQANALLISKAPEMLEMLKECMRVLSSVQSPATPSIFLHREIEQLIKEATELNI